MRARSWTPSLADDSLLGRPESGSGYLEAMFIALEARSGAFTPVNDPQPPPALKVAAWGSRKQRIGILVKLRTLFLETQLPIFVVFLY